MFKQQLKLILDKARSFPPIKGFKKRSNNYPSSASVKYVTSDNKIKTEGACLRSEWYSYKLEDSTVEDEVLKLPPVSPRMSRIFETGEYFENMFCKEFERAGMLVASQVPFYIKDYNISGRIDGIIRNPLLPFTPSDEIDTNTLIGVEFKTIGGYFGSKGKIFSTKDTPLRASVDNVLQVLIYLHYFKNQGINKWILFYIDRGLGTSEANPDHWNVFTVELNEKGNPVITHEEGTYTIESFTIYDVLKRFEELTHHVENDILPARDYKIQYSNQEILDLYKNNELNKKETETVAKAITKAGDIKKLTSENADPIIKKGDWKCSYCSYVSVCYSNDPTNLNAITFQRQVDVQEPTLESIEV